MNEMSGIVIKTDRFCLCPYIYIFDTPHSFLTFGVARLII